MANLHQLLKAMIEKGASDLHITTGLPPQLRIDGRLVPLKTPPLTPVETKQLCYSILTDAQKHQFEEENELDLSFGVKNLSRFRANIYMQRGAVSGAFRTIPFKILSFQELGLPQWWRTWPQAAGPGAGDRPHRLGQVDDAGVDDRQDQHRAPRAHPHGRGSDRVPPPAQELHRQPARGGRGHRLLQEGLKYVLRQDPDVILIGEMRDLETIEAALVIAETGHLVFATLHTNSCVQTINRILDVFPPYQQPQVRAQLSMVLEGVLSQTLIPKASGSGRVLAMEVMVPNMAIRNLIREDKVHQIYGQMQIGQSKFGMQTMNQALAQLVQRRLISFDDALLRSSDQDELRQLMSGVPGRGAPQAPQQRAPTSARR
jgi:twitching motility protein PilT